MVQGNKTQREFHAEYIHNAKEVDGMIEISDKKGKVIVQVSPEAVEPCFVVDQVVLVKEKGGVQEVKGNSLGFIDDVTNDFGDTVIAYQTDKDGKVVSSALFMEYCVGTIFKFLSGTKTDEQLYKQIAHARNIDRFGGKSYEEIYENAKEIAKGIAIRLHGKVNG